MASEHDTRGSTPIAHHADDVLFPADPGTAVVYLGKEALLAWLTDIRSAEHQEAIDRFYNISREQTYYTTSTYTLAEVATTVRYRGSATKAAELQTKVAASSIRVKHGSDDWSASQQTRTPRDIFTAVSALFAERSGIRCSFPEAALILGAAREQRNRQTSVYLFTYDGTLATLADTFQISVLPFSTPLRDDTGR